MKNTRFEHLPTKIFNSNKDASRYAALEISDLIRKKAANSEICVLGLATGSTPISIYNELVRLHKEEKLSFANVITFNLDEYYPMQPHALQSYVRFMHEYLFNQIDINKNNIHIPDGTLSKSRVQSYCKAYEKKIAEYGGIDLQILGIGRTGHIGFNEPGSDINSETRLITLDSITKTDAASDFFSEENVPYQAITMGVGTIMKSGRILLIAFGEGKAGIIKKAVEGKVDEQVPASYLQKHHKAEVVLDVAAADELVRIKSPWLVQTCKWDDKLIKKAVCWLSLKLDKPILKLTDRDYIDNGMDNLLIERGSAYKINIDIFNKLQHTITGWPGGKPNVDDTYRPERAAPSKKRILIFSPHPDDDVISMGGTFIRLFEHGHDIHVAYQTSGNIAVFDDDVIRFADFSNEFNKLFKVKDPQLTKLFQRVSNFINKKKPGEIDNEEVRKIKTLIRRSEARSACRYIGLDINNAHFLDLPFYETGTVKKKPLGEKDITITVNLLRQLKPHQIYAAGDLSDPHGTHRVCLEAIIGALEACKKDSWLKNCYVWLYRGAWQEWGIHDIEMAVPLSPGELLKKRKSIFKHQSQKDSALFPGPDEREFWERAEARNRATADIYNKLGLPEYEAIEGFKRYYF
ncbi:MAG TPA: glucosamine-6-phosphate deaminase [Cyclobacteriaceae bacterium]